MRNELATLLLALRDFLEPLRRSFAGRDELEFLFYSYGWDVSLELDVFDRLRERASVTTLIDEFMAEADAVREALATPESSPSPEQLQGLGAAAQRVFRGIADLELSDLTGLAAPLDDAEFWKDVGRHVLDDMLERYVKIHAPHVYFILRLFRAVRYEQVDPAAPHRRRYRRTVVDWNRVMVVITDPSRAFSEAYAWGHATDPLDHRELLAALADVFRANRVAARLSPLDDALASAVPAGDWRLEADEEALRLQFLQAISPRDAIVYEFGIDIVPAAAAAEDRITALALRPILRGGAELSVPIAPAVTLQAKAALTAVPAALIIAPQGARWLSGQVDSGIDVTLVRTGTGPLRLFGSEGGSRVEVSQASLGLSISGPPAEPDVRVALKLGSEPAGSEGGRILISLGDADGFVKSRSGSEGIEIPFALELSWSSKGGFRINGSAGFDFTIPFRLPLVVAELRDAHVVLRERPGPASQPQVELKVGTTLKGRLGPIEFLVGDFGFAVLAIRYTEDELHALPPDREPLLGTVDLQLAFAPPESIGLSVSGGGFTGGGFLRADRGAGEYAGALELKFGDQIHVKAVGILNTGDKDGKGFGLTIIISAEFSPIQLGFGFVLVGVGGLIGVNRTIMRDQLRTALRDGSLESVLFPKNVATEAPRIIADLKRLFPSAEGRYLIGPMAKLGWGTPPLATLEIGLILEIPGFTIVILGVLRIAVPPVEEPLLKLQVNFVGQIDFDKKQFSLDATLYDSRLLTMALTGDMAVRFYWGGENANILGTVGGFHPAFTPPPMDLPPLDRLTISIFDGNPRLRGESYFAFTSNTQQFGTKLELYYGVSAFSVEGFLSLDALLQFVPFRFIAEVVGSVAVRAGGSTLFSIRLELVLEGPGPWRARGRGSFEIGFVFTVTVSASFDVTLGDIIRQLQRLVSVLPLIDAALREAGNWLAVSTLRRGVALREVSGDAGVLVPPMGTFAIVQNVAPLGVPIQRLGPARIEDATSVTIVDVTIGGEVQRVRPRTDLFAAAQYLDMSDDEKLSRRPFEHFTAGIEIETAGPQADFERHADVAYEVIYLRKPRKPRVLKVRDGMLDQLVGMSAAAKSPGSATRKTPTGLGTPSVTMPAETFVIATVDTLAPHVDLVFSSEAAAVQRMKTLVRDDRRLAGRLQVIERSEVAA